MKSSRLTAVVMLLAFLLGGCSPQEEMRNGYYTAEAIGFDAEGWKEFITIYVSGNSLVTVEYNARNSCGFIQSWDLAYQHRIKTATGMYPGEYWRIYADELRTRQNPDEIVAVRGVEHQHKIFLLLAKAAIAQAKARDTNIALVDLTQIRAESQ
jgi:major membrane immunogen (membrane-anchored lipoprotein)